MGKKGLIGNEIVLLLVFLAAVLIFFSALRLLEMRKKNGSDLNVPDSNKDFNTPVPGAGSCTDGTLEEKCSTKKPFFCGKGILAPDCKTCGCNLGSECDESTGQCVPKKAALLAEDCITVEGLRGRTGLNAVEKVLLKWDFESIDFSTCDAANANSYFCDPTQFCISLAHRLKQIREAAAGDVNKARALAEFESLVIADNFSEDFLKDFAFFYQSTFFDTPSWFAGDPVTPWSKYFSEAGSLVFSPGNLSGEGSGLYKVKLLFDFKGKEFEFFENSKPSAKITVSFSKIGDFEGQDSVFYHLPLNGMVGTNRMDEGGKIERKDYGIGFSEKQPRLVFADTKNWAVDSSAKSARSAFAVVVLDKFIETNSKSGFVSFINPKGNAIVFVPSYAVTVVAGIRFEKETGGLFYRIFEGIEVQGASSGHLAYWTTVGRLKAGEGFYSGSPLELGQDAKIGGSVACIEATPEEKKQIFGLHWAKARPGEKALLESFFFIPLGKRILIESVCSDPTFVFATENQKISGVNKKMELGESSLKIAKFYELVDLVRQKDICVVDWEGGEYFYWNANSLRPQEGMAVSLAKESLGSGQTSPNLFPSAFVQSFPQSEKINKTFSSDYSLLLNIGKPVYGLAVTGKASLLSGESVARIILKDSAGKEFLAFEAFPLVNGTGSFSFEGVCEETCALNGIMPASLKVQAKNAQIELVSVSFSTDSQRISPSLMPQGLQAYSQQLKSQQEDYKSQRINEELAKKGLGWTAGKTWLSGLSYEEKKVQFMEPNQAGELPYLYGFEYYAGGTFETGQKSTVTLAQSRFPASWDWRERHGANNPESPYYSGENGWLSTIKDQGDCGACWAFATIASIEATANLYANKNLGLNLSEQELLSCSGAGAREGACKGGFINGALGYIKSTGVSGEQCMPYSATAGECNKCAGWQASSLKINHFSSVESDEAVKEAIIKKGPLASAIWFDAAHQAKSHAMTVIGWETGADGQTEWIFKDSTGLGSFEYGYYRIKMPWGFRYAFYALPPITIAGKAIDAQCVDFDKDNYCNWGLDEKKPASCPAACKTEKDCDDSNPSLGSFDEKFNCKPLVSATHKECVNGACVEVAGAGTDKCQSALQCGQQTHKACSAGKCLVVPGQGIDECQSDLQCMPKTHKVCQDRKCVEVSGAGQNTCTSDEQCIQQQPQSCTLMVKSQPRALFYLDGASYGMTPMLGDWGKIENVAPGNHTARFEREGFATQTENITLRAGQTIFLDKNLAVLKAG